MIDDHMTPNKECNKYANMYGLQISTRNTSYQLLNVNEQRKLYSKVNTSCLPYPLISPSTHPTAYLLAESRASRALRLWIGLRQSAVTSSVALA